MSFGIGIGVTPGGGSGGGGGAVSSVYGRTGAVVAQSGDYSAAQVTNTPAGNVAASTVQAAINELDAEKASVPQSIAFALIFG